MAPVPVDTGSNKPMAAASQPSAATTTTTTARRHSAMLMLIIWTSTSTSTSRCLGFGRPVLLVRQNHNYNYNHIYNHIYSHIYNHSSKGINDSVCPTFVIVHRHHQHVSR
mmetsp:Transcript_2416/g.6487  ORF Transcript_2416/g.6487 Transcript_2416/m.6487 type:complete len:110 (+) Transcript_2416:365-694(+)